MLKIQEPELLKILILESYSKNEILNQKCIPLVWFSSFQVKFCKLRHTYFLLNYLKYPILNQTHLNLHQIQRMVLLLSKVKYFPLTFILANSNFGSKHFMSLFPDLKL